MLTNLFGALLLTVGAMAVDSNCIQLFEDEFFVGTSATLCYDSKTESSFFKLEDYGIDSIGSYKAGSKATYNFCYYISSITGSCVGGSGPLDQWIADFDYNYDTIEVRYKWW